MKPYFQFLKPFVWLLLISLISCDDETLPSNQNELVAVAGADKTITVNQELLLDGSGSFDKNNKPFTHSWSIKSKPSNSNATLLVPNAIRLTFVPDVPGTYLIELKITQGTWSDTDEVSIIATPDETTTPQAIILDEDITENTTLINVLEDPSKIDYIVTKDIQVRADLLVLPGVTIAFQKDKGLEIISGTFKAIGTPSESVFFKGMENTAGFWRGITIYSNSPSNELQYVSINQAGSISHAGTSIKANLLLAGEDYSGGAIKIQHTVFSESGGYGLYMQGMSSLTNFANNAFINNIGMAAYITAQQLHKIDVVSFTGTSGIETGGPMLEEEEVVWKKLVNASYFVTSNIVSLAGIRVEAGTSFKMSTGITISVNSNGYLNATGTEALGITFTSVNTNTYWNGLFFNSFNGNNRLIHCEVSNAGLNRIADADHNANIAIGHNSSVTIESSIIKNGLGYGVVAKSLNNINDDITTINSFQNLQQGVIYPTVVENPERPTMQGVWLDYWSYRQGATTISDNFYNKTSGIWFGGVDSPWDMDEAGFGIKINEDGSFTWLIAEPSPMSGCESYSAEFITGQVSISDERMIFNQDYWRSKFINECDTSQNVDIEVSPSAIALEYRTEKLYDFITGEEFWKITFINPDGSTFSFYRK